MAADTVYTNGRVYTVDEARPWADAVAVVDGRIAAVGSSDDLARLIGRETEVVELNGAFVMPGIHDAHVHPGDVYKYEEAGYPVFPETLSPDEIAGTLLAYAAANPDRDWIRAQK